MSFAFLADAMPETVPYAIAATVVGGILSALALIYYSREKDRAKRDQERDDEIAAARERERQAVENREKWAETNRDMAVAIRDLATEFKELRLKLESGAFCNGHRQDRSPGRGGRHAME